MTNTVHEHVTRLRRRALACAYIQCHHYVILFPIIRELFCNKYELYVNILLRSPAGASTRRNSAHDAANIVTHTVTAAATARWCVTLAAKVSGCLIDRKRNVVTPTRLNDDIDSNAIVIVVIDVHIVHPPVVMRTLLFVKPAKSYAATCSSTCTVVHVAFMRF